MQQALDKLKGLSADAETRRMAFVRERALRDESSALRAATEKGVQQEMHVGEAAVLKRLLTRRFGPLSEDVSVRLSTATLDQLDLWADRILDAQTLAAVFDGH